METKSCELSIKQVSEGKVIATLAHIGVIDRDGDVLKDGLLKGGQIVAIKPQHKWDHVNLGVAHVYEKSGTMEAAMEFNMAIPSAKDWFESIRFSHEKHHRQQYSFGFHPIDVERGVHDGKAVRFLKQIDMAEVSPVLIGASIGSQTLSVKEQDTQNADVDASGTESRAPETSAEVSSESDVKRYTIEQLLTLLESQLDHVTFIQDIRSKKGKMLNAETIEMIDETSKRFDILRAKVKLGAIDRLSTDEELEARYERVFTQLAKEEEIQRAQGIAMNEELLRSAQHRLERVAAVLQR